MLPVRTMKDRMAQAAGLDLNTASMPRSSIRPARIWVWGRIMRRETVEGAQSGLAWSLGKAVGLHKAAGLHNDTRAGNTSHSTCFKGQNHAGSAAPGSAGWRRRPCTSRRQRS